MNDKETIISLLNEFANPKKMASFFVDNATPDFLFTRSWFIFKVLSISDSLSK